MNKKTERLTIVRDLYIRQEKDALMVIGNIRKKLQDLQNQLLSLKNYRLEYESNILERQKSGINIGQFLEFRRFAEKLDKAIDSQQQQVFNYEQDVQRASKKWEECHQRTKSITKLLELKQKQNLKVQDKLEQLEQDARSSRLSRKLVQEMHD
jgi:flagellar FliJ protein